MVSRAQREESVSELEDCTLCTVSGVVYGESALIIISEERENLLSRGWSGRNREDRRLPLI